MLRESVGYRENPWICRFILKKFHKILYLVAITYSIFGVFLSKMLCFKGIEKKKGFDFMSNTQYNTDTFYV